MKIVNIAICVFVSVLFLSCVKEDRDNCPPGEQIIPVDARVLYFETIPATKYNFRDVVETVRLYVYDDDDDRLLRAYRDVTVDELMSADYGVILSEWEELPDDNYHIIGIVNLNEHYEILDDHSVDSYQTRFISNQSDEIDNDLNDMFVGYIKLDPVTKTIYSDTIYMEKLTNRIYLTVEFENFELPAGTELESYITGSNSEYNYMNNSLSHTYMTYKPYLYGKEHETMFNYNITTGKLYLEDDLELHIEMFINRALVDQVTLNLTDMLALIRDDQGNYLYNTNQKLQEEDEFWLYVLLSRDFEVLSLQVNNWFLVEPGIDL